MNSLNREAISEAQYEVLCKACDFLLKEKSFSLERNANSYLHVIREHPIFLKSYSALFFKGFFSFFIYSGKKLLWYLILGIFKFFHAILRYYILGDRIKKDSRTFNDVFISHFLNDSFVNHKSDFYFFDLPSKISKSKKSSLQLYINFSNKYSNYLDDYDIDKPFASKLLPKYLPLFQELKIRVLLFREAISILKVKTSSNFEKRVKYQAAIDSISSTTHSNYRLAISIQQFIKKNNIKRVFTTYEGHPWERLIFAMARKINPSVVCIGYQHAILFKKQHAIKRKLEKNFEPDYILFSGKKGLNSFKAIDYLPSNRLILFGTNRLETKRKKVLNLSSDKKKAFLILPEGDLIESVPLTKFVLQLALKYPQFQFIFRYHPITNVNQVIRQCPLLKQNLPNVKLSNESFTNDLARAQFVIYRGSTTIIKAVQNGLIPLYYQKKNEITIDPLFDIQQEKINLISTQDLDLIFDKSLDEFEKSQTKIIEHVNDFFSPINYDEILNVLKYKHDINSK